MSSNLALIYPPPWKISGRTDPPFPAGEGPPAGRELMSLGGDFLGPPYGLLLLAAQAKRAGHDVATLNLANFEWCEVERVIAGLDAAIFGMTCLTANRRGVLMVAELIRRVHPQAHIVVGGPHASALPRELLDACPAIDTVVIGEGEGALLELCDRVDSSPRGIPGTAWRDEAGITVEKPRDSWSVLDDLEPLHEHYATPFVITSRGCPGRCTFCGCHAMWGPKLRLHSVSRVLDTFEKVVVDHGLPLLAIKDDTFTANRRRTLEICEGIRERGLRFLWICDTRVDALDAEVLEAMRAAGCQQISIGVESGSTNILNRLRKRITPEEVLTVTELAKAVGIGVRWYLILGSPGETFDTLEDTFDLLREGRPHQAVFTPFSTYPGTGEHARLLAENPLDAPHYFDDDFWTPVLYHDVSREVEHWIREWLRRFPGISVIHRPTIEERRAALSLLPDLPAQSMDLAGALVEAGELSEAESLIRGALEHGHPIPSIGQNYLACLALTRGDAELVERYLEQARAGYPFRHVASNWRRFQEWRAAGSDLTKLELEIHPSFEIAEEMIQPMNPGPVEL